MKKLIFILNLIIVAQFITEYVFIKNSNAAYNAGYNINNNVYNNIYDNKRTNLNGDILKNIHRVIQCNDTNYNTNNYIGRIDGNINKSKKNTFLSQIKLFGTFAASYTYNFANPLANSRFPQGNYNGNYIDNYKVNGFTINELDLTVSKNAFSDGRNIFGIGFKATLDIGENIQDVGPYTGNYSYYTEPIYNRPLYGFRNLYISLGLPVGNGLKVEIGEKNYLIGFESYNLSRLWENTYSPITAIEPGELTGIFLSYPFIPKKLKMVFGTALTDNAMVPIDRYPTFEFITSYKPFKNIKLKFHEGIVYGAENFVIYNNSLIQDNVNKFFYNFADVKYSPFNFWTFVLDYEVGLNSGINKSIIENNNINANKFNLQASATTSLYPSYLISTSNSTYDKSHFSGLAFYIHHFDILSFGRFSQTIREVMVWDPNGMWEENSIPGEAFNYFDSTFTIGLRPNLNIFKNTQFRLEFENQIANRKVYGDGNSTQNTRPFKILCQSCIIKL